MKKILVSGSTAYDFIMAYDGLFKSNINNLDKINLGLLVNNLKRENGGTGLNIAYNLAMLGENAILLTSVGDDFIFGGFLREKINLNYIYKNKNLLSASGYIINDKNSNQIIAFYPGAMDDADKISVKEIKEEISYAIVSPNKKEAMIKHLIELKEIGVKTFFDPGQQIGVFDKNDLITAFSNVDYLIVNEYEYEQIKEKLEKSEIEIINYFEKIIVTMGAKGSRIIYKDKVSHINSCSVENVVDTTGAGDAFRAGLLKGLKNGFDFELSAKIGTITASYCIQFNGGQNHFVSKSLIEEDMKKFYGIDLNLV